MNKMQQLAVVLSPVSFLIGCAKGVAIGDPVKGLLMGTALFVLTIGIVGVVWVSAWRVGE